MQFWDFPGPSAFLESIEDQLRAGSSTIVALPDPAPLALLDSLCARMDSNGWERPLVHANGQQPLDTLFDSLGLEAGEDQSRSVQLLLARLSPSLVVVVDDIGAAEWPAWQALATEYERLSRSIAAFERPLLLLLVRGVSRSGLGKPAPALKLCIFDDVVSEIDMLAYADLRLRESGAVGPQRRLAATTIARLALCDTRVADRLSQLSLEELFAPHDALADLAIEFGWQVGEAPAWERGTCASVDGTLHTHSALLALEDKMGELEMRMWSAQASTILPLIELHRRAIVERIKHRLRMPRLVGEETITDPFELEVAELGRAAQAAGLEPRITSQIARLRYLRNQLAHLEVLYPTDALDKNLYTLSS
jgi:hypothetical protein